MPARRTRRLSYANVTSSPALFIALGGVSWAAATLPANSVGKRQLDNAVTGRKVANGGLRAADFALSTPQGFDRPSTTALHGRSCAPRWPGNRRRARSPCGCRHINRGTVQAEC